MSVINFFICNLIIKFNYVSILRCVNHDLLLSFFHRKKKGEEHVFPTIHIGKFNNFFDAFIYKGPFCQGFLSAF